jgi:hypothetical protein
VPTVNLDTGSTKTRRGAHEIIYAQNTAEREGKRLNVRACYLLDLEGDLIATSRALYEDSIELTKFGG